MSALAEAIPADAILACRNLSKSFGAVRALQDVSFHARPIPLQPRMAPTIDVDVWPPGSAGDTMYTKRRKSPQSAAATDAREARDRHNLQG